MHVTAKFYYDQKNYFPVKKVHMKRYFEGGSDNFEVDTSFLQASKKVKVT